MSTAFDCYFDDLVDGDFLEGVAGYSLLDFDLSLVFGLSLLDSGIISLDFGELAFCFCFLCSSVKDKQNSLTRVLSFSQLC